MNNNKNPFMKVISVGIILFAVIGMLNIFMGTTPVKDYTFNEFNTIMNEDRIEKLNVTPDKGMYLISGVLKDEENKKGVNFKTVIPKDTQEIENIIAYGNEKNIPINFMSEETSINWLSTIISFLPIIILGFLLFKMVGSKNNPMNAGENKAKLNAASDKKFSDVIGYEEEKNELVEIVDFLKNPSLYNKMGAKIPNGVLLEGPPGTGKTLMAKAVAGEAHVPFLSISGSDFVEMYVGVGASRVRKLFIEAKKRAPSIVFIDEIDAIGSRDRGGPNGGSGHAEQEQTINALLVELDGFSNDTTKPVIIIGATNRADKLDQALLRPGRFDRKIMMGLPELTSRENILKYHGAKRSIIENTDYKNLARSTSGMSGAQLEAVINEGAILAVREKAKEINEYHLNEAIDRVLMGPAKTSNKYSKNDKKMVSYHESGHAISGLELTKGLQVQKITIIPRRNAGGYVSYVPNEEEERFTSKKQLEERLITLLAGRAAEELFIGDISVGAYSDFESATNIARAMVTKYGMSNLGLYQLEQNSHDNVYANKQYSEETAIKIDQEINKILENSYEKAKEILKKRQEDVHLLASTIQEVESLDKEEIDYLLENRKLKEIVEIEKFNDEEIKEIEIEEKIKNENIEEVNKVKKVKDHENVI